ADPGRAGGGHRSGAGPAPRSAGPDRGAADPGPTSSTARAAAVVGPDAAAPEEGHALVSRARASHAPGRMASAPWRADGPSVVMARQSVPRSPSWSCLLAIQRFGP